MILHNHDVSFKRLASCWKRAECFAKKGDIDLNHPLTSSWNNCKLFLEAQEEKINGFNLVILDWFALKLNDYSKSHLLKDDITVSSILYEWKEWMFVNPVILSRDYGLR